MTDPRTWGRGDRRRIATSAFPVGVVALVDERLGTHTPAARFCIDCKRHGFEPERQASTDPGARLELDHLQPLARGGDNHHSNLTWRCASHNRGRCARAAPPAIPQWKLRASRPASRSRPLGTAKPERVRDAPIGTARPRRVRSRPLGGLR